MASLTKLSFHWTGFISAMISNIAFTYRSIYSKKQCDLGNAALSGQFLVPQLGQLKNLQYLYKSSKEQGRNRAIISSYWRTFLSSLSTTYHWLMLEPQKLWDSCNCQGPRKFVVLHLRFDKMKKLEDICNLKSCCSSSDSVTRL